jgi:hypothetical protein
MALNELCGYLDLTRQAIIKRLALLESDNLIFTMAWRQNVSDWRVGSTWQHQEDDDYTWLADGSG